MTTFITQPPLRAVLDDLFLERGAALQVVASQGQALPGLARRTPATLARLSGLRGRAREVEPVWRRSNDWTSGDGRATLHPMSS